MFFTENNDFLAATVSPRTVFAVRDTHLSLRLRGLGFVEQHLLHGGRTTVNDVANDDKQENVRLGVTVAFR